MSRSRLKRAQKPKPEGEEAPPSPKPAAEGRGKGTRSWAVVLAGAVLGGGLLLLGVRSLFGREPPPSPAVFQPAPPVVETRPVPPPPPAPAGRGQETQTGGGPSRPDAAQAPLPPKAVRDPFGLPPYMASQKKPEAPAPKEPLPSLPLPPPPAALPSLPAPGAVAAKPPASPRPAVRCRATFFGRQAGAVLEAGGQEFTLLVGESAPAVGKLIGVKPGECLVETKEGRFNLKMEER